MKKMIMVTMFLVTSLIAMGQGNKVNIQLVDSPQEVCKILLWPQQVETGALSNLVFTLKWKTNQQVALGQVLRAPVPVRRVGQPIINGQYTYQVYVGLGFDQMDFNADQPDTVLIDRTGSGEVTIAADAFSNSLEYNGQYYISIGGYDVTGDVLQLAGNRLDHPRRTYYRLYYDTATQQILVEHDSVFTNTLNQQVQVVDKAKLHLIR